MRVLNTDALKRRYFAKNSPAAEYISALGFKDVTLSRRRFLQLSAGTALWSAVPSGAAAAVLGALRVVAAHDTLRFYLHEELRWEISSGKYDGAPKLFLAKLPESIEFRSIGGFYPGTSLRSDLTGQIQVNGGGYLLQLTHEGLNTTWNLNFEDWTSGELSSVSKAACGPSVLQLSPTSRAFMNPGLTAIEPTGALRLSGRNVLEFEVPGQKKKFIAQAIIIHVCDPSERSPSSRLAHSKKTRIICSSGETSWHSFDLPSEGPGWSLVDGFGQYQTASIELGRDLAGQTCSSIVFEGDDDSRGTLHASFDETEPHVSEVAFVRPILAFAESSNSGYEFSMMGELPNNGASLHSKLYSLGLSNNSNSPSVVIAGDSSNQASAYFEGSFETVNLGLGDHLVESVSLPSSVTATPSFGSGLRNVLCSIKIYCGEKVPPLDLTGIGLHVVDPEQLLVLNFRFVNLRLAWHDSQRVLERTSTQAPGYIIVELPAQGIAEQNYYRQADGSFPNPPPNNSPVQPTPCASTPESRLVFITAAAHLPFDLQHLLNWEGMEMSVSRFATPKGQTPPTDPMGYSAAIQQELGKPTITAVNYPFDLTVSPSSGSRWFINKQLELNRSQTTRRRVPLWHARLMEPAAPREPSSFRALWTSGYNPSSHSGNSTCQPSRSATAADASFLTSLTKSDREQLVTLTSDTATLEGYQHGSTPNPLQATSFILTPLGTSLRASGAFPLINNLDLASVDYRSVVGRDERVEVQHYGYLFPSWIPVTLVIIAAREINDNGTCGPAYMIESAYITWADQTRNFFNGETLDPRMPFQSWTLQKSKTPALDWPGNSAVYPSAVSPNQFPCAFWPKVGGEDVKFDMRCVGADCTETTAMPSPEALLSSKALPMPQIYVSNAIRDDAKAMAAVKATYNISPNRIVPANSQKLAFARSLKDGDTTLETTNLYFSAANGRNGLSGFQPLLGPDPDQDPTTLSFSQTLVADLKSPPANSLSGDDNPLQVKWPQTYLDKNLKARVPTADSAFLGEVFLANAIAAPQFQLPKAVAGGVLGFKSSMEGLSRQLGPVADLDNITTGKFDPTTYIPDVDLFGGITMKDIVRVILALGAKDAIPKLISEELPAALDLTGLQTAQASLAAWVGGLFQPIQAQLASAQTKAQTARNALSTGLQNQEISLQNLLAQSQSEVTALIAEGKRQLAAVIAQAAVPAEAVQADLDELLRSIDPVYTDGTRYISLYQKQLTAFQSDLSSSLDGLLNPGGKLSELIGGLAATLSAPLSLNTLQAVVSGVRDISVEFGRLGDPPDFAGFVHNIANQVVVAATALSIDITVPSDLNPLPQRDIDVLKTTITSSQTAALGVVQQKYSALTGALTGIISQTTDGLLAAVQTIQTSAAFVEIVSDVKDIADLTNEIQNIAVQLPTASETLSKLADWLNVPTSTDLSFAYEWNPEVHDGLIFVASKAGEPAQLSFRTEVRQHLDLLVSAQPSPSVSVDVVLTDFQIVLLPESPLITIPFNELHVASGTATGTSVTVDVDAANVDFGGVLEFIEGLAEFLGLSGDPGLTIDLSTSGIGIGFETHFPNIECGAFNLYSISFGATLVLPFGADPARFKFSFCERQKPCFLAIEIFGGGFFCAFELTTKGIYSFEAAIEFGAEVDLDIDVAEGSAYIVAGVYFAQSPGDVLLSGYLRAGGDLNIIHLITMSVTFYMGFTYQKYNGVAMIFGEAMVCVEIDILFFSTSVELHCRRQFAGGSSGSNRAHDSHALARRFRTQRTNLAI